MLVEKLSKGCIRHIPPFGSEAHFEQNSHVKVRNKMLIKKLTKGYVSHIPPFGNEAH